MPSSYSWGVFLTVLCVLNFAHSLVRLNGGAASFESEVSGQRYRSTLKWKNRRIACVGMLGLAATGMALWELVFNATGASDQKLIVPVLVVGGILGLIFSGYFTITMVDTAFHQLGAISIAEAKEWDAREPYQQVGFGTPTDKMPAFIVGMAEKPDE